VVNARLDLLRVHTAARRRRAWPQTDSLTSYASAALRALMIGLLHKNLWHSAQAVCVGSKFKPFE